MKKYNNPLNNIKIASPCAANWDEMYGNERKRHCSECKLNVYNLSDMTQTEAENFLIKAEGRVCVKFYRRTDGTVLTQDCPVGWQAAKRRLSRTASAVFTICFGIISGLFAFRMFETDTSNLRNEVVVDSEISTNENDLLPIAGEVSDLDEIKTDIQQKHEQMVMGQLIRISPIKNKPVKLQIR